MSSIPIIGISGSLIIDQGGNFPGYERAYVNNDYVQSVANAGGTPFIIPLVYDENIIRSQVEGIDALILSGGHDINPLLYCLLYTSDAADDLLCVDLGGR